MPTRMALHVANLLRLKDVKDINFHLDYTLQDLELLLLLQS